jgi:hypothetical protein
MTTIQKRRIDPMSVSDNQKMALPLGTLCGRDQSSKTISKRFSSRVLAFYLAEIRRISDK